MQPKNIYTCAGLAALWLTLASSCLGAPYNTEEIGQELLICLDDMREFVCNGTFFKANTTELQGKDCFIKELQKVKENCQKNGARDDVLDAVVCIEQNAETFFKSHSAASGGSCERHQSGSFEAYRLGFVELSKTGFTPKLL